MGHRGEQALTLGVEDLLASQAVVAAGQGAELVRPFPSPLAIALHLHERRLSRLSGERSGQGGLTSAGASARAMRLASAGPR